MGVIIFLSKRKYKFKTFKLIFLIIFIIFLSLILLYTKYPNKLKNLLPNALNIKSSEILTEDTLINEIKDVNKLIPLEIELSETLTVDNTYFNLDIFKKSKKITFFANCSYSIDFSTLSTNNIKIDNSNKEIYITIPKIDINEIYINANDMFSKKMNNQDFYTQTLKNAENSLESLLFNLTGEHYDINLTLS